MRVRACANVQIHVKPTAPKFSPIIYAKTLPLKYNNERVIDFYRQGEFDITGLITHRFPLKDYKEARSALPSIRGRKKPSKWCSSIPDCWSVLRTAVFFQRLVIGRAEGGWVHKVFGGFLLYDQMPGVFRRTFPRVGAHFIDDEFLIVKLRYGDGLLSAKNFLIKQGFYICQNNS